MTATIVSTADEWEALVTDCFVPLSVERIGPAFSASTEVGRLNGAMSVTRVQSAASTLARGRPELASSGADALLFVFHEAGEGRVSQFGRDARQRPGESVMYLTDEPYRLEFPQPIDELVLQIPTSAMSTSKRRLRELSAVSLPSTLSLRAARAAAQESLGRPSVSGTPTEHETESLRTALCGLLDSAFAVLDGSRVVQPREVRSERIRRFIVEHAADPKTSVDSVAAAFSISRRSLYSMFDDTPDTPASLIRDARLARAERLLRNEPERPISHVWALCGFDDPTTFSRAFKARTGSSPSRFRRAS